MQRGVDRLKAVTTYSEDGWVSFGNRIHRNLPATRFNYEREAGNLWDNSIVRMGLKWIEDTYPEARQVVYRPGAEGKMEQVPKHRLLDLVRNPRGPLQIFPRRVHEAGLLISLKVNGNAYEWIITSAAGLPVALVYLPHYLVRPIPGGPNGWISHYEYRVGGSTIDIPVERMIHHMDGNDPETGGRSGLSRLGAALREVCTVNEIATFEATLLRARGVPSVIVNLRDMPAGQQQTPTADQAKQMKRRWQEDFTGDNRFTPLISTLPIDVHPLTMSPNDMALDKIAQLPIAVICGSLNLDPMVLGLPSDDSKKYSNFREAREAAYEECIIPTQRLIDETRTEMLMPMILGSTPQDELGRDYSDVRALQEDMNELHKRAREDYKAGLIKRKEGKRMIKEEYDETKDDVYLTDIQQVKMNDGDGQDSGDNGAKP